MELCKRKYDIASIGVVYWKSLTIFECHLEDGDGNYLKQSDIELDEHFWVIFPNGTGYTRTSGVRVA